MSLEYSGRGRAVARRHAEHWIPAEELDAFNEAIVGSIEVIAEYPTKAALREPDPAVAAPLHGARPKPRRR